MKLTDVMISAILKKGILLEMKNFNTTVDIPMDPAPDNERFFIVTIKADNLSIKIEKGD